MQYNNKIWKEQIVKKQNKKNTKKITTCKNGFGNDDLRRRLWWGDVFKTTYFYM